MLSSETYGWTCSLSSVVRKNIRSPDSFHCSADPKQVAENFWAPIACMCLSMMRVSFSNALTADGSRWNVPATLPWITPCLNINCKIVTFFFSQEVKPKGCCASFCVPNKNATHKNSSMELAAIWGNSDFGCFDFGHSDFCRSDFSPFFFLNQQFLLFSLNIHNLGTCLVHTQMEQIWPNGTFTYCFTTISTNNQNNCPISILKFFIKQEGYAKKACGP